MTPTATPTEKYLINLIALQTEKILELAEKVENEEHPELKELFEFLLSTDIPEKYLSFHHLRMEESISAAIDLFIAIKSAYLLRIPLFANHTFAETYKIRRNFLLAKTSKGINLDSDIKSFISFHKEREKSYVK